MKKKTKLPKSKKANILDELYESVIEPNQNKPTPKHSPLPTVMKFPLERVMVFNAINSERDYQDKKWGNTFSGGRPGDGWRSVDEYVTYIAGYASELLQVASHSSDQQAKLNLVRKVAGLCVACMEQHGAPLRK